MDCPVCGAENETGAVYCYRCGSMLRPATVQPQTATQQALAPDAHEQAQADARVYQVPSSRPATPYVVGPVGTMTRTSNLAILALVLGIVSWIFLPFVGGIGAVITGHLGRREIRESQGQLTGEGLATAGLVLGYLNLALTLLLLVVLCIVPYLILGGASTR